MKANLTGHPCLETEYFHVLFDCSAIDRVSMPKRVMWDMCRQELCFPSHIGRLSRPPGYEQSSLASRGERWLPPAVRYGGKRRDLCRFGLFRASVLPVAVLGRVLKRKRQRLTAGVYHHCHGYQSRQLQPLPSRRALRAERLRGDDEHTPNKFAATEYVERLLVPHVQSNRTRRQTP